MADVFKGRMFLANKSPRSYVGLCQKFLHKSSIITDTSPPEYSSRTSPDATTAVYGPNSTLLNAPQESAPIRGCQCAFPKRAADAAIRQSPGDTSIPSDTPRPFIQSCLILFFDHSRVDLTFWKEVYGLPVGGVRLSTLWQKDLPSSTRDPEFDCSAIFPRGTYWGWSFQGLKLGRRHFHFQ